MEKGVLHLLMLVQVHCAPQRHDLERSCKNAAAHQCEHCGDEEQRHHHRAGVALLHSQDAHHEQLEHEQGGDDVPKHLRPKLQRAHACQSSVNTEKQEYMLDPIGSTHLI